MNKYKIMIVDDEPDILELLEKSLAIEGFQNIIKIDNGLSAVSSCRTLQPDMIILDVMLPGIDGYEVCKQIRDFLTVLFYFYLQRMTNWIKYLDWQSVGTIM